MKHLYIYITLLMVVICSFETSAQSALHFTDYTADYGHIREDGGVATCTFNAINSADTPVVVTNVITSCGCTTAQYERRPIAPGGSFRLDLRYDPMNRPGRFDRTIYVEVSDSKESIKLRMVGYVTPRERSVYENYPFDMGGGLRLQSNFHAFAYVEHGKEVTTCIGYMNNSDREIEVYISPMESSGALHIICPRHIPPHATGDITLTYRLSETSSRYGTLNDKMRIVVDGTPSEMMLTTYAIAVDNFDNIDDISAPRADISKKIIKFGDVYSSNTFLEGSFEVKNIGNTPLIIRRVEVSDDATVCDLVDGTVIDVGTQSSFGVRLLTSRISPDTPYSARITVVTNDPVRPMQTIRVSALPR